MASKISGGLETADDNLVLRSLAVFEVVKVKNFAVFLVFRRHQLFSISLRLNISMFFYVLSRVSCFEAA